uniref:Chorismate lyase n=1 Tax=Alsidium seaforthii TaxID=2007182 RepID=A0A1Z1MCS8_9FLOR|nr:hypothetical protein [Bryothamnion seaforthii]ARW63888.1 hypothetical protein [Bryothamnion seaforthii]
MNLYINKFTKFHSICILPVQKMKDLKSKLPDLINNKWQLILINEGSLTNNIQYLSNSKICIKALQKGYKKYNDKNRIIRYVWMETSIYTSLIFARSLWILTCNNLSLININSNHPIGLSFITRQIDIYKEMHEIYYGYCQKIEKEIRFKEPIWGRKYTLRYKGESYITIQEFFSPRITNLFK